MTPAQTAFAVFGLTSQGLLVAFFAARRWWPRRSAAIGKAAYACAGLGLPLAIFLLLDGHGDALFVGPLLMSVWAGFGAFVDVWRPRPWRGPPIQPIVLGPYVAVYVFAQMFLWWPLWEFARAMWVLYAALFIVNTALNIQGHARHGPRPA